MMDREQQLIDAAMRYQALLDGPHPLSIGTFVETIEPELRDELRAYLEFTLALEDPQDPIILTGDEQVLAERALERSRARVQQRMAAAAPPQTLTALRQTHRMSLGALATQLNLPVDLLHRIERGGVRAATIPPLLISRFATVLQQVEVTITAAINAPQLGTATNRLSAQDGTKVTVEPPVDFADALATSSATDKQKAEWG